MNEVEGEEATPEEANFKARPLKKHILEKVSQLPVVEKKRATEFAQFKLSQSNKQLASKTLEEY